MPLGIPENFTWWDLLNSEFFSLIIGLLATGVGAWLARNVHNAAQELAENAKSDRAQRTLETLRDQELEAAEGGYAFSLGDDDIVEINEFESVGEEEDYFDEARASIDSLKSKIDKKVAGIRGSRKQRKYQIPKYDYREFVYLLAQDGLVEPDQMQSLISAFTSWYTFRNRNATMPQKVFEKIKAAEAVI